MLFSVIARWHSIRLLSSPNRGLVYTILAQNMLQSMSVYRKLGKQPSDAISYQNNFITSTIFVVFFAYLPSNRSTSFVLKPSYYLSEVWEHFISDYDVNT